MYHYYDIIICDFQANWSPSPGAIQRWGPFTVLFTDVSQATPGKWSPRWLESPRTPTRLWLQVCFTRWGNRIIKKWKYLWGDMRIGTRTTEIRVLLTTVDFEVVEYEIQWLLWFGDGHTFPPISGWPTRLRPRHPLSSLRIGMPKTGLLSM